MDRAKACVCVCVCASASICFEYHPTVLIPKGASGVEGPSADMMRITLTTKLKIIYAVQLSRGAGVVVLARTNVPWAGTLSGRTVRTWYGVQPAGRL